MNGFDRESSPGRAGSPLGRSRALRLLVLVRARVRECENARERTRGSDEG